MAAGLASAGVGGDSVVAVPIADGGDGTVDAAVAAGYRQVAFGVRGPSGPVVNAAFALRDGIAVIESAQACGLALLAGGELAPLTASTQGVGEADPGRGPDGREAGGTRPWRHGNHGRRRGVRRGRSARG